MDTRTDHASTMRLMAGGVARDLASIADGVRVAGPMGLRALFRMHSAFRSHGWHSDPGMAGLAMICDRVFASEPHDHRAFVRGMRSVAGIEVADADDVPATIADRDVFWSCVDALAVETGVTMPPRRQERSGPSVRGH